MKKFHYCPSRLNHSSAPSYRLYPPNPGCCSSRETLPLCLPPAAATVARRAGATASCDDAAAATGHRISPRALVLSAVRSFTGAVDALPCPRRSPAAAQGGPTHRQPRSASTSSVFHGQELQHPAAAPPMDRRPPGSPRLRPPKPTPPPFSPHRPRSAHAAARSQGPPVSTFASAPPISEFLCLRNYNLLGYSTGFAGMTIDYQKRFCFFFEYAIFILHESNTTIFSSQ